MKSIVAPAARLLRHEARLTTAVVPAFTRPISFERRNSITAVRTPTRCLTSQPSRRLEVHQSSTIPHDELVIGALQRELPLYCPGCGAPTQEAYPEAAGYFNPTRSAVKKYLNPGLGKATVKNEDVAFSKALENASPEVLKQLGLDNTSLVEPKVAVDLEPPTPICDRCHNLLHYHQGQSIIHPSIDSIEETIAESTRKKNHIYHVLDAADFPMSLVPGIQKRLSLARLRTQNRRSKSHQYIDGKLAEMSFIITRSDLLAPKKEQVDTMMYTLKEILRDALGSTGRNVRLGNVRCVSAKRGWWTKEVKEDIWEKGGACWMVGKVNVGKSNLFEVVFPKGRSADVNFDRLRNEARNKGFRATAALSHEVDEPHLVGQEPVHFSDEFSLLPPAQPETNYPVMPIVSELPGTTASPIRVPFGNGKGELIDLPGIERSDLQEFVKPEHRPDLIMKKRVTPERIVMKPGQSLLLGGGLIRITPKTDNLIFMAHPFVPDALDPHLTSTLKAEELEKGERDAKLKMVATEEAKKSTASAGTFKLSWDVTRKHAGPLTRKDAAGLKPANLHFVVYATDILIEGCGWVELVAQVRKKKPESDAFSALERAEPLRMPEPPEVEIFSPEGRFIGQRQPLNCWLVGGPKDNKKGKSRPRPSMAALKARIRGREKKEMTERKLPS